MRQDTGYKPIIINQFIKLLEKLYEKGLLNEDGGLLEPEKYCRYENIGITEWDDKILYNGRLKYNLSVLNNYEIVMLMAGEDVISYNIRRDYLGNFNVIIYK